ncbi:unnamed protein product [Caenorhabditis auriculariae]|uniref:Nuclear receptor domain-containing protein n=1 Tax=Caenorhabditis auriculariae TaxID=2777116 RepID=A0A8S1HMH3_9PELO|nr:unnamed protein product [Caenorhabditis auriculariae]
MSCLVCEMTASGQHFGVRCCRACAAFFRRTLNMSLRYKCRFERKCEVTLNKRYSCRFCRFEKCQKLGMKREMVQIGKRTEVKMEHEEVDVNNDSAGESPSSSVDSVHLNPGVTSAAPSTNATFNYEKRRSETNQPNISLLHRSVIEEVGKAVLPSVKREAECGSDSEASQSTIFALAAAQATQDLHTNVQQILTPAIDAMFDKNPDEICSFPAIPLTICQQALLAYHEHNRQWPSQDNLRETKSLDMEVFMRHHYIEIEHIARFCMSIRTFAQLPKDQKWIIFKHFWTRFYELDRSFATCQRLGYNIEDERCVCFDGLIVNMGISIVNIETFSDMDANEVKSFMKGTHEKFRLIFINPFKKLRPSEFELVYMMMSIMWSVGISTQPDITDETRAIAKKVENRLAEDLHNYYAEQQDQSKPNYASRITKLSSIASAVNEVNERRREDSQVSKTFNIFKSDIFFSDISV